MVELNFLFVVGLALYFHRLVQCSKSRLPPGPEGWPLIGNIGDVPPKGMLEHEHWLQHKDRYGPLSSVTILGTTLILIHDHEVADELLRQLSSKTSGRPHGVMANELSGYGKFTSNLNDPRELQRHRKLMHSVLGSQTSALQFEQAQIAEVRTLLLRILEDEGGWLKHIKITSPAVILKAVYGYRVEPHGTDPLITIIEKVMQNGSIVGVPMYWAPDLIPALRNLPHGFPGFSFQKAAHDFKRACEAARHVPYEFAKRQTKIGLKQPCYVSDLIKQFEAKDDTGSIKAEDEEVIMWTAASLFAGAADTTAITLTAFALAMLRYPEVQRKAQAEIDAFTSSNRLPQLADRPKLPYIDAVVKETLRWWPVLPMGFPHLASEDFSYRGYDIPKGAVLTPNVHWLLHDPKVYPQPDEFDPARYLEPRNEPDPAPHFFGYGRRACPGRFFADNTIFLVIAQTLAHFNFVKAVDGQERELPVEHVTSATGLFAYPSAFNVRVVPRSVDAGEKLREMQAAWLESNLSRSGDWSRLLCRILGIG